MRKALLALLVALPLVACGISEKEAQESLTGIEAIPGVEPTMRTVLLANLCAESDTCMGDCKEVLKAMAQVAAEDRILLVRQCDPNVKPPAGGEREAFDKWMADYVGAYVKKVRAALPEADRGRLDKAWAATQK